MLSADPRTDLIGELAALADHVAMTELTDAQLAELTPVVAELRRTAEGSARPPWWKAPDRFEGFRSESPFSGAQNPHSLGLELEDLDEAGRVGCRGRILVNRLFAGPPGAVHGGVLAGLFDEVVGAVARRCDPSGFAMTATLKTRYAKPTPLDTSLVIDAWVAKQGGRRLSVSAMCRADGVVTATAEALMVRPPSRRR